MAQKMQSSSGQLGTKSIGNWTATDFGGLGDSTKMAGSQMGASTLGKSSSDRFSKSQFLGDKVRRLPN